MSPARLSLLLLLALPAALSAAQDDAPATEESGPAAGREVELSEDNYRRFMELRDARVERSAFPVDAQPPGARLEKMDSLPPDSQRHLRDRLREIIMNSGAWTPDAAQVEQPFEPSPAALADPALRAREAEAWGELLENYHQREAAIYANAGRSRAASATGAPEPGQAGQQGDAAGTGTDPRGEAPGATAMTPAGNAAAAAAQRVPESAADAADPAGQHTGVSQSALGYLREQGLAPGAGPGTPGRQAAGNQAATAPAARSAASPGAGQPPPVRDPAGVIDVPQGSSGDGDSAPGAAADPARTAENTAAQADAGVEAGQSPAEATAPRAEVEYLSPGYIAIRDLQRVTGLEAEADAGPDDPEPDAEE